MALDPPEHDRGWRETVFELSSFARPSASAGERRAAELIAERLRERGCATAVERELAHGGYWWPLALANLLALAGARAAGRGGRLGRAAGALLAGLAAAALWDDLGHGRRWFRRALLPRRPTWNVLAHAGDAGAERTIVLVAHHDAAHSGLVFHPALGRIGPRLFPRLHARSSQTLPILYGVWLGPVLICAGAVSRRRALTRLGSALAASTTLAMADIGARASVPGANDNLAAVGVLIALAEHMQREPTPGVRVLLLSTGSEESFSEGMQAFMARHRHELDPQTTDFLCLECLGGPELIVLEGEGMLRMRSYSEQLRDELAAAAERAGVPVTRGLRTVAATDAIIALRAGYRAATLAAIDHTKLPLNYHWPTDVPEQLHWQTVQDALTVCERLLRERSRATTRAAAADAVSG
jgi:hypothetical protein